MAVRYSCPAERPYHARASDESGINACRRLASVSTPNRYWDSASFAAAARSSHLIPSAIFRHGESGEIKMRQNSLRRHVAGFGRGADLMDEGGPVDRPAPTFEMANGKAQPSFVQTGIHSCLIMGSCGTVILKNAVTGFRQIAQAEMGKRIALIRCLPIQFGRDRRIARNRDALVHRVSALQEGLARLLANALRENDSNVEAKKKKTCGPARIGTETARG